MMSLLSTNVTPLSDVLVLNAGHDEFVQDSNAIDVGMLKRVAIGSKEIRIRGELYGFFRSLEDVFVVKDKEWVVREATAGRVGARFQRAFRKEADADKKTAERAATGSDVDANESPTEDDGLDSKGHKRTHSKTSEKSFPSASSYIRADFHVIAEVTIRAIQDNLAQLVIDELVEQSIEWVWHRPMRLDYSKYNCDAVISLMS